MPKIIQVIESTVPRGKGVVGSTFRNVTQYHTLDGVLLAENDPYPNEIDQGVPHNQPSPPPATLFFCGEGVVRTGPGWLFGGYSAPVTISSGVSPCG